MQKLILVFVHGWSVTNLNTYGELPIRLRNELENLGLSVEINEIFLGKYVSFHDEVKLEDISRTFTTALEDHGLEKKRFICITHSTGGPVIRDWWHRFYPLAIDQCPMTHLIMLAPANYGSALAQLGKARVGRLKSWLEGIEPGQGVLDWLELGSNSSWNLNKEWITKKVPEISEKGPFPFVLTGQSIDRKLYDTLNSYTGELGSDGVVRVAAANLEGRYLKLQQVKPALNKSGKLAADELEIVEFSEAPSTPLRVVSRKSHSGKEMGILTSVKANITDEKSTELVNAIIECIQVDDLQEFESVTKRFAEDTHQIQAAELVELEKIFLLSDRYFIHDRYVMVIFKVVDSQGYAVKDYDLVITAGKDSNPNLLPPGFFMDRQRNRLNAETITYFLNYDIIKGADEIIRDGKVIRPRMLGIDTIGLEIVPRPESGFIHYLPSRIHASREMFEKVLVPNSTTLIEICLRRVLHKEVFELEKIVDNKMPGAREGDFKKVKPGDDVV